MKDCDVRIVPHNIPLTAGNTWYKVQVQKTIFRIGTFRMWIWWTVGDYPSLIRAKTCRAEVKECYEEKDDDKR